MPLIPVRNKLIYPAGVAPRFDPNHPMSGGAKVFSCVALPWGSGQLLDVLKAVPPTKLSTTVGSIDGCIGPAVGASVAGGGQGFDFTNYWANCPTAQPFTLGCIVTTPSTFATSTMALIGYGAQSDSGGFYLRIVQTTGTLVLVAPNGGISAAVSSFALSPNTPYFLAASSNTTGISNYLALNLATGQIFTSIVTKTTSAASANGTINVVQSGGRSFNGRLAAGHILLAYRSMDQLRQWADDPWSFWYPQRAIRLADVSTAPATIAVRAPLVRNRLIYPAGTAAGFDVNHPAASNIRFSGIVSAAGFIDLLSAKIGTKSNVPTSVLDGAIGPATNCITGTDGWTFAGRPTVNDTTLTIAGIFRWTTTGTSQLFQSSSAASGVGLQIGANTLVIAPGGIVSPTLVTFAVGTPYFVAASIRDLGGSGIASFAAVNLTTGQKYFGQQVIGASVTSAPNGTYFIGNGNGGFKATRGNVAAIMFSAGFVALDDLRKWAENPWAFWYPTSKRSYLVSSGPVTYVGPGDIVAGAIAWGSCARAYSAAYAASAGPLMDIRNSGGTSTTINCLTTGLCDTAALAAWITTNGAASISKLYDQTGNGNHFTQATFANMPVLTQSAQNGLPAMTWAAGSGVLASPTITLTQPLSMSSVYMRTGAFTAGSCAVGAQTSGLNIGPAPVANTSRATAGTAIDLAATDNVWHAQNAEFNGATSASRVDATDSGNVAGGANTIASAFRFGRSQGAVTLTGLIMEGGLWPSAFSSTERSNINSNQQTAYALGGAASIGALAATEAQDTASFTGNVDVSGTLAVTETQDTALLTGNVGASGILIATEAQDIAALTGSFGVATGILAATEATDTALLSGNVAATASGILMATESPDTALILADWQPPKGARIPYPSIRDYGWYDRLPPIDPNRP